MKTSPDQPNPVPPISPARRALGALLDAGGPGALRARMDGWLNTLTGLGTSRDKTQANQFQAGIPLDVGTLEALFHHDDLAARIVSAVPDEAFKLGFSPCRGVGEAEGDDLDVAEVQKQINMVTKSLTRLGVSAKVHEAWTWGRLYGGGAILLGVEGGGRPELPLDDSRVTAVKFLTVLDRRDFLPATYYTDPLEGKYGQVETYFIQPSGAYPAAKTFNIRVHETRLAMFRGVLTGRQERERNQGWDYSVLQKPLETLRDVNGNWDSVVAMMADMSQAVYKIKGLIDMIAEGDSATMQTRMALVDAVRSVTRGIILDAEGEDFKLVERGAVTGVDALLDKSFLRLAAAAKMPVTILMGQAPAGLQATGESDLRWWYDSVESARTLDAKPQLERITRLVAQVEFPGTDVEAWSVEFPSLWQMTPQETADLRDKVADTDVKYISAQVVLPEEITLARWGSGKYSMETKVDLEARRLALKTALEDLADPPKPPPVPPPGQPGGPPQPGQAPAAQPPPEGQEGPSEGQDPKDPEDPQD